MKVPAQYFKALADETRLRILALLLVDGELCVCHILGALKLPQSTVSRHLAYLRRAGLVNDRRCGLWMYYSINTGKSEFHKMLVAFLGNTLPGFPDAVADVRTVAAISDNDVCR